MRSRLSFGIIFLVLALGLRPDALAGQTKGSARARTNISGENLYAQLELFADAISVIKSDYVDEADSKKLIYGALKGLLGSLDDYSQFMDPDEYKDIKAEAKGEFAGIGIELNLKDGILTVIAPISGSPADQAGVMAGDRIVKIGGRITKKMTLDDAVRNLRGDPGTTVKLTLWREKEDRIIDLAIKRSMVKVESVKKYSILEERIGYIKLIEFQENTPADLDKALAKLKSEGMDSLILDLRDNPGGLLDTSVAVAEKFLPMNSVIVSTKSRAAGQSLEFRAKVLNPYVDFPIAALINEGSASASEILAGAIQDNRRGIVVGAKSFGKGSVQTVIPMRDGSALKLTTASYFTPSGRSINGEGIIPDVIVEKETYVEPKEKKNNVFEKLEEKPKEKPRDARDSQLMRAIDIIKGIKAYYRLVAHKQPETSNQKPANSMLIVK